MTKGNVRSDGPIEGPAIKAVKIEFTDGRVVELPRFLVAGWEPTQGQDMYVWGMEGPEPKHCWTMVSLNIAQQFLCFSKTPREGLDPKWLEELDAYLDSLFLQITLFKGIIPPVILQQVVQIQNVRQLIVTNGASRHGRVGGGGR